MSLAETVGGEFWVLENPESHVRGEFTAEIGKRPEVTLAAPVADDPRVTAFDTPGGGKGYALSGEATKSVAAFQPITLHGQLDSGEAVTLLSAQNHGGDGWFGSPHYVADVAVLAAHVSGPDQRYSAVRFRIDDPYWLAHLSDSQSSVVGDDGSTLGVGPSDGGNWLVYESSAPATLRQLEMRVVSGCLVLVRLALDHDVVTRESQVRVDPGGPWLAVHGSAHCATPGGVDSETLLPPEELTVERFAKWIALNDRLDGLAWAVADPVMGAVQAQVQVSTSLVEGLQRRLPYEQSRFPVVPKGALRRVREAAWNAAAEQAEKEGLDRQLVLDLVKQAVGHVGDVSFRDRADGVVTEVCGAVPEIAESVADLAARLTKARNDFAHHLLYDEAKEPLADRVLRWAVLAQVTPWLLRGLLLLHAGVVPGDLRAGYLAHRRFEFYRANVAQMVSELGWELPSSQR
jgi:hypothetical protein